jgi:DNA polymerase III sliding clamp (beta) subunit (PCNA family)
MSKLTAESVVISLEGQTVVVSCGKSKYKFGTLGNDEFPVNDVLVAASTEGLSSIDIPVKEFMTAISKIAFCVGRDVRPQYSSALLDIKEDKINFVSTDTKQLSLYQVSQSNSFVGRLLLSLKALDIIKSAFSDVQDDNFRLCADPENLTRVMITKGDVVISSQVLSGVEDYPNYNQILTAVDSHQHAIFTTSVIRNALSRVNVFLSERYQKMILTFAGSKLSIAYANPDRGEAAEEVEMEYHSSDVSIALNPYIIEALSKVSGKTAMLGVKASTSPVCIQEGPWMYVVMPLNM